MYLIPYIILKNPTANQFNIKLFLENGGKSPIQIASFEAAEDFLGDNEFFLADEIWSSGEALFAPIDSSKTTLDNFYNWTEISNTDKHECWRTFLVLPEYFDVSTVPVCGEYVKTILSRHTKVE
jgi:hypothetical protein